MAKKKPKPLPLDSFLAFYSARAFQMTSTILDRQPNKPFFIWPLIVNETFSLELHLKSLHRIRRRIAHGHNIRFLFESLSMADRKKIESHFNAIAVQHPLHGAAIKDGIPMDLESVLTRSSDLFHNARYWFQGHLPTPDSKGHRTNAGIGPLSDAVMQLILELRPDWRSMIKQLQEQPVGSRPLTT